MTCKKLSAIDRYMQRLGDIDPDWEWSRYVRKAVSVMPKPYYHDLQEKRHITLLSYLKIYE
jgi:hypothetical protein